MKKTSTATKSSGNASFVFFGSGPVAAKSLALLAQDFEIEAVVTKPATVKEMTAVVKDLCVYSVNSKQELDDLIASGPFRSDLGVLIDFGIIVSQKVIDYFSKGIVNSHFSLLPQWRGADPITFSILSGQEVTGVSLMLITAGMDEGPLLSQSPYLIPKDATTPELTDTLIDISYATLKEILPMYLSGEVVPRGQDLSNPPTFSRKLTKGDGVIDWAKPAEVIEREIRAFLEWPKSRTIIANKDTVITKARVSEKQAKPGQLIVESKSILVGCGQGSLFIEKLKPAGKKEMTAAAFLAGYGRLLDLKS